MTEQYQEIDGVKARRFVKRWRAPVGNSCRTSCASPAVSKSTLVWSLDSCTLRAYVERLHADYDLGDLPEDVRTAMRPTRLARLTTA